MFTYKVAIWEPLNAAASMKRIALWLNKLVDLSKEMLSSFFIDIDN